MNHSPERPREQSQGVIPNGAAYKIRKPSTVIPKISHETLGGLIRSTRSRVCHLMNKFKKQGYIEYGKELRVHSSSLTGVLQESMFSDLRASRPN